MDPKDKSEDGQEEKNSTSTPPEEGAEEGQEKTGDEKSKDKTGDEKEDKAPLAGFADLSKEDDDDDDDDKGKEGDEEEGKSKEKTAKDKDDKTGDDKSKDDKSKDKTGDEGDPFEFKMPEKGKGEEGEEGKEETWKGVGKDLDLEVEGDNFSDLKAAYEKKLKNIEKTTRETVIQEIKDDPTSVLKDIDDITKNLIKVAATGADLTEYLDPVGRINGWLALDDEKLVRENYKVMKNGEKPLYSEERIDAKVTKLIEDGQLSEKADTIKEDLISEKAEITEDFAKAQSERQTATEKSRKEAVKTSTKNFHTAVDSITEFMNGKVGKDLKTHIKNSWNSGEVHELFKDPQKIAEFVLFHLVGDQALEKGNGVAHGKGRVTAQGKLHNVPPVSGGGGANRSEKTEKPAETGDFGAWGGVREEMAEG